MTEIKRKNSDVKLTENRKNGVLYFSFPAIDACQNILHGFSSRIGGVSQNEFAEMNLSFTRGDHEENVYENFRRIAEAIGFECSQIVSSNQTHTTNVRRVSSSDSGYPHFRPGHFQDVDGLITNEPGVVLATFYADCVPLYFVDPVHHAIGLSHSGWKGTVNNIAGETVRMMKEEFGTEAKDLIAAIGPSICQDCYEVSEDVISQFKNNFPPEKWDQLFYQKENGKYQLNLWEACRYNMLHAQIPETQITTTDICTCCNPEILFSHRASKGKRGNLGAFLGIRKA